MLKEPSSTIYNTRENSSCSVLLSFYLNQPTEYLYQREKEALCISNKLSISQNLNTDEWLTNEDNKIWQANNVHWDYYRPSCLFDIN